MNWSERKIKILARKQFFDGVGRSNSYLSLPGAQCEDVKVGLRRSVLDPRSRLTLVEHDAALFNQLCLNLSKIWRSGIKPVLLNKPLSQVLSFDPIDLAYLDYLGNLTFEDSQWIGKTFTKLLLPNAHIGITVASAYRNNGFIPAVRSLLQQYFRPQYNDSSLAWMDRKCPKSMVEACATYELLINYCLFADFQYDMKMYWYGEPSSPFMMLLIVLNNVSKKKFELSEVEASMRGALNDLVYSKNPNGLSLLGIDVQIREQNEPKSLACSGVIKELMGAKTTAQRHTAERCRETYIKQQEKLGKRPEHVARAIKAVISRRLNRQSA